MRGLIPSLFSLVLLAASAPSLASALGGSDAACKANCYAVQIDCKRPYEQQLASCKAMHGCGLPSCTIACTFGCAECNNYWGHYIDTCATNADQCTARCGHA